MAISPVYQIAPVYPIASLLSQGGSVSGPGSGPGGGIVINPPTSTTDTGYVTFRKATYGVAAHGGPVPGYPVAVTMPATVTPSGTATREPERGDFEHRPLSRIRFKVEVPEDPAVYLGSPLITNDLMEWAGYSLFVLGTAFPQGTSFEITGELIL